MNTILVLGEILFDIFPDAEKIGGAPFNFAFHLKMLGFDVRFFSRVGQDDLGDRILAFIEENQFDVNDVQTDPDHPTGTVRVTLDEDGDHAFSIVKNTAYDHMAYGERLARASHGLWHLFYTGTLIQRNENNAGLVQKILKHKSRDALCFCDINLRPGCYSSQSIRASLEQADILKLNHGEMEEILGVDDNDPDLKKKVRAFMAEHSVRQTILTSGERGSQWITPQISCHSRLAENSRSIRDTVGAGDAYAAVSAAGILTGLSPQTTMHLAQEFAGRICEIKGALPKDRSIYRDLKRRLAQ